MGKRTPQLVEEAREAIQSEEERVDLDLIKNYDPMKLVPTGSTLLNLALSGYPHGGFLLGTIHLVSRFEK